jgi:hypothetical protein
MKNKKSLRSSQMRSLGAMGSAATVNSIRPVQTQTPLDKIVNNFYIDDTNETIQTIYDMIQDANNRTTSLSSLIIFTEIEYYRRLVIYYFTLTLKNFTLKNKNIFFLNLMDVLINTNWVIDEKRSGRPLEENLTSTKSYTVLNNLVDFYDKNRNILKEDLDNSYLINE